MLCVIAGSLTVINHKLPCHVFVDMEEVGTFIWMKKRTLESTELKLTGKKLILGLIKDENFLSKKKWNSPFYLIHEFSRQKSTEYWLLISKTRRGDCRVCGSLTSRAIQIEAAPSSNVTKFITLKGSVIIINLSDYNCLTSIKVSKVFM